MSSIGRKPRETSFILLLCSGKGKSLLASSYYYKPTFSEEGGRLTQSPDFVSLKSTTYISQGRTVNQAELDLSSSLYERTLNY